MRDGKREDFKSYHRRHYADLPDRFGDAGQQERPGLKEPTSKFGMDIENMTDQWRQANGVKQAGGVRIVSVKPDSFAEEIRLEPGDILLAINRTPVNSVEEVGRVQAGFETGRCRAIARPAAERAEWRLDFNVRRRHAAEQPAISTRKRTLPHSKAAGRAALRPPFFHGC